MDRSRSDIGSRAEIAPVRAQKGGLSNIGKLFGILTAIARGGDFRFLLLFLLTAFLAMPRPSGLFRLLNKLGVTSRLGKVVAPDGSHFKMDFRSLILIYEIYLLECYECLEPFRILPGDDVIDVGSNIGLFSVKAAREVGLTGRVISIEPHPVAFELLRDNIQVNGLRNITAIPVALGSRQDEAPLLFSRGSTVGTFYDSVLHSQDNDWTVVKIVTLDSLVAELRLERVDFLKIDVEGAEMDVLEGAAGLLERGIIHKVVVETHGEDLVSRSMDFLTSRGFHAVALDVFPSFFVGHPFPTVFALRVERPVKSMAASDISVVEKLINPNLRLN